MVIFPVSYLLPIFITGIFSEYSVYSNIEITQKLHRKYGLTPDLNRAGKWKGTRLTSLIGIE